MIYTFYSFKGGVGRSMALANIAECFHARGLRVVMIDWDLEAPGLETYFMADGSSLDAARAHAGLIDMLLIYTEAFPRFAARRGPSMADATRGEPERVAELDDETAQRMREAFAKAGVPEFLQQPPVEAPPQRFDSFLADLYRHAAPLADRGLGPLASLPLSPFLQCIHPGDSRGNGLFLLSAGRRDRLGLGEYAARLQDFSWGSFYAAYEGAAFVRWLRGQLLAAADVVLIDSRTGVTEVGGVCTRHIPDAVIALCAPNRQNTDGIAKVLAGLNGAAVRQAREDRAIDVLVVPTRIDVSESDRLTGFAEQFQTAIEGGPLVPAALRDLARPLWRLAIPYIPRCNYGEERVIGPGIEASGPALQPLVTAYETLAVSLAAIAPATGRIRQVFAGEIGSVLPHLTQKVPHMAPPIPATWVAREVEQSELKVALFRIVKAAQRKRLAVWGAPGTGKTSLVAALCHSPDVIVAFPDGVLWASGDRSWSADAAREWLGRALGLSREAAGEGLQAQLADLRYLLVVDDVRNPSDVDALLQLGSQCAQVIVTGDRRCAAGFTRRICTVGDLDQTQAEHLLSLDDVPMGDDDPRRALMALTTSPLVLVLARTVLEESLADGEPFEAAIAALGQAFERHGIVAFDPLGAAKPSASVSATMQATFGRLSSEERARLIAVAASDGTVPADDGRGRSTRTRQRLIDLGLIRPSDGRDTILPLARAYIKAEGHLSGPAGYARQRVSSSADKQNADEVNRAKSLLRGERASFEDIVTLADTLRSRRYFGYARRLYARARTQGDAPKAPTYMLELVQREVHCTYRDLDLSAEARFDRALNLLRTEGDLDSGSPSAESLTIAGSIMKGRWQASGRRTDLESALAFYQRGAAAGVATEGGYAAINASLVLDLLAKLEGANIPEEGARRRAQARALREQIVVELPATLRALPPRKQDWWFCAVMAEACFGLQRHGQARYWLREGLALSPVQWQVESTARQLVALALAQGQPLRRAEGSAEEVDAHRTLRLLFGETPAAIEAATIGKVGLALSGGGFRASFFHIGVLARMAELDMLRHVEVLSCVSGGSIVGAHYYLEIRHLLQKKADAGRDGVTRQDYIDIVRRLETEFLAATRANLRMRLFAGLFTNIRTLVQPGYSRTDCLGSLLERRIYARVDDGAIGPRWLNELAIVPKDADPAFNPKTDNFTRCAKVPILLLNATSLNTGHVWQFAVNWMGEPPLGASASVDRNEILRRLYYWEAPRGHQRVRLGTAVAASACVPALFDPIELRGLFPDRTIRLVDGGVHDNQGIVGLTEQDCTVMLVSDASGQTDSADQPSGEVLSVATRANNILMARVREAQFREIALLCRSSAVSGFANLHLKKGLEGRVIDWVDCNDPAEVVDGDRDSAPPLTAYGIPRTLQARLAGLRTDLDAFSDLEAYALMLSGYRMASTEFDTSLTSWPLPPVNPEPWGFRKIEPAMTRKPGHESEHARLMAQLGTGARRGFKVFQLLPWLAVLVALIVGMAVALTAVNFMTNWPVADLNIKLDSLRFGAELIGLSLGGGGAALWLVHRLTGSRKSMTVIATGLFFATIGWLAASLHLLVFNPIFLRIGRVREHSR